ncbi:MAG: hypothetical protein ABIP64_19280 [Burkholderiales bacterium]
MANTHLNPELTNRSFIASVLYVEIADYADRPVFEQIQLTALMRQLVDAATTQINGNNWFLADREDSLVLLFLGEPDACFTTARQIKYALENNDAYRDAPLHIGLNLGPVGVVKGDLNPLQVSGTGVDDAAQVARGGELREILISRAYYAVLARISKDYGMLQYKAFVSDERDEAIAVYRIADGSAPEKADQSQTGTALVRPPIALAAARMTRWRYAALPVAVIALVAISVYQLQRWEATETTLAAAATNAAIAQPASESKTQPALIEQTASPASAVATQIATSPVPEPAAIAAESASDASKTSGPNQPMSFVLTTTAPHLAQTTAPPLPLKSGTLRLAIKPWGEIYVDGKKVGLTPPLHKIKVAPGKRKIVVRNANFLPYSAIIVIKPESFLQIAHRFGESKPKE